MDNYPSHVIGHYSTLHLTRWKDLCCGKFKTVHLGYRLIELLHRGCGQWEMRFFAGTDEHYGVWRGSITEIGSNRGEALSAGSQLSGQSMPIQSNCFNNRDGISRCFPRFEMWIVSFLFFFYFPFISFFCLFVCLFVCLWSSSRFLSMKISILHFVRSVWICSWCPLLFTLIEYYDRE